MLYSTFLLIYSIDSFSVASCRTKLSRTSINSLWKLIKFIIEIFFFIYQVFLKFVTVDKFISNILFVVVTVRKH